MTEIPAHYGVTAPTCPYCNVRITVHQTFNPGHCGAANCVHKHAVKSAILQDAARKRQDQSYHDAAVRHVAPALAAVANALESDVDAVRVAAVPYQNNPVVPLPRQARDAFLAHLETTLTAAFQTVMQLPFIGPIQPAPFRSPSAIEEAGCTACQGYCCQQGRSRNAFLSQQDLETVVRANPTLGVAELLATYIAAMPARSVENACVFQSDQGCTLPRDWRSETCNTFICRQLFQLSQLAPPGADAPIAIVAVEKETANILAYRDSRGAVPIAHAVSP